MLNNTNFAAKNFALYTIKEGVIIEKSMVDLKINIITENETVMKLVIKTLTCILLNYIYYILLHTFTTSHYYIASSSDKIKTRKLIRKVTSK